MARLKELTAGTQAEAESPKYALVAMAGTFDALHRGHRKLLKQAFTIGRKVMIGVTTDEFARSLHKPHKFDPYPERKKDLERGSAAPPRSRAGRPRAWRALRWGRGSSGPGGWMSGPPGCEAPEDGY